MSNNEEQARQRAADEILGKLTRRTFHQTIHGTNKDFVTQHDLENVWTSSRLKELFTGLIWAGDQFLDSAREKRTKILSILIKIRWNRWEDFKRVFVDSPGMLDTDLPISDIQVLENALGDAPLAFEFQTSQYVFLPIIIQENQDVEYLHDFRWPFTEESKEISPNSPKGSLPVHKEVIAPWQFRDVNGDFNAEVRQEPLQAP